MAKEVAYGESLVEASKCGMQSGPETFIPYAVSEMTP